jgi:hypothetical protein
VAEPAVGTICSNGLATNLGLAMRYSSDNPFAIGFQLPSHGSSAVAQLSFARDPGSAKEHSRLNPGESSGLSRAMSPLAAIGEAVTVARKYCARADDA